MCSDSQNNDRECCETPLRKDAFEISDKEKIQLISHHFGKIMDIMGLDLEDDSLKGTPKRVAKMYINEIFSGLNPDNKPKISLFENKFAYDKMIIEKDITVHSNCEHHFVPFMGKAHVAYFSKGKVIGLSKINRLVHYFSKRPQLQERLTLQIAREIKSVTDTDDVAVLINAKHMCVASRGIQDVNTSTITAEYYGKFNEPSVKAEFLRIIGYE
ncbi:MAG: GTP cyclohydrolase I FolE [Bacteroidetes bacterium]|jgi:GTP cyclohydrolase IA|nr:GTP cyclohydrolase I FolE [Bacteroidota bacterium]MBT5529507.1 GTP cyclohydrolase I FolE [Cytophagia bacterium]MBT3423936.1 GTP cyclohydrolase I FolE [Bacteroidota bacterium]MBT3802416.1 GTP cyclohydrolase I FolE [Bacteroidota bacterium]MBT3934939.1 GTP cyclohydrolase I FolE [Bacteroidota bacterium]